MFKDKQTTFAAIGLAGAALVALSQALQGTGDWNAVIVSVIAAYGLFFAKDSASK